LIDLSSQTVESISKYSGNSKSFYCAASTRSLREAHIVITATYAPTRLMLKELHKYILFSKFEPKLIHIKYVST
jgi:hypothetical protein